MPSHAPTRETFGIYGDGKPWKAWADGEDAIIVALPDLATPLRLSKKQAEAIRWMLDGALDDAENWPDAVSVKGEPKVTRSW